MCWKCGEFDHLAKEFTNIHMCTSNMQRNSLAPNCLKNVQSGLQIPQTTGQIRYPTAICQVDLQYRLSKLLQTLNYLQNHRIT